MAWFLVKIVEIIKKGKNSIIEFRIGVQIVY